LGLTSDRRNNSVPRYGGRRRHKHTTTLFAQGFKTLEEGTKGFTDIGGREGELKEAGQKTSFFGSEMAAAYPSTRAREKKRGGAVLRDSITTRICYRKQKRSTWGRKGFGRTARKKISKLVRLGSVRVRQKKTGGREAS